MKIQAFVPSGSGAWVMHEQLRSALPGYRLRRYSRWWELFPPAMPLLRAGDAQLVHATLDYGALFQRSGVPLVVTAHNYVLDAAMVPYASVLQRLHYQTDLRWLSRLGLQRSDRVVAVSQFVADCLKNDLGFQGRIDVIYNGVLCHQGRSQLRRDFACCSAVTPLVASVPSCWCL
jgi:glycosyltransferase involved in cell wall biosynthesis